MTKQADVLRKLYTTLIDSRDGSEQAAEIVGTPAFHCVTEQYRILKARVSGPEDIGQWLN